MATRCYRSIDIVHAGSPLSGFGSTQRGGRYNRKNTFEAYYVARSRRTALLEVGAIASVRGVVHAVSGRALLTVDVRLRNVLDLRDPSVRAHLGVSLSDLYAPWLTEQTNRRFPLTQRIGEAARRERFEAILAPSDADKPDGWNLVVIPETMMRGSRVSSTTLSPGRLPFVPEILRGRM